MERQATGLDVTFMAVEWRGITVHVDRGVSRAQEWLPQRTFRVPHAELMVRSVGRSLGENGCYTVASVPVRI